MSKSFEKTGKKKARHGHSGYHHNTLYDFLNVMPGLFAYGDEEVLFSDLQFKQLE